MFPFMDPAPWTEEDEIPWDFDSGGSFDLDGGWTGLGEDDE